MDDEGSIWRCVARMNLAQPGRHVGVKTCDERDACRTAKPSRPDTSYRNTEKKCKRCDNPADINALRHVAHGLDDPLQHAYVIFAHSDKQSERNAEVQRPG